MFILKVVRSDGREEAHVFVEYEWYPETKTLVIRRDEVDAYEVVLEANDTGYAQAGRDTFSVFNRTMRDLKNDPWSKR